MIIYIDSECKCHADNPNNTYRAIETDFFDGKCSAFIEGYKFSPSERKVTRPDGAVFDDGMKTPWKPYNELAAAQAQYEADLAEAAAAYQEGVDSAYDQ